MDQLNYNYVNKLIDEAIESNKDNIQPGLFYWECPKCSMEAVAPINDGWGDLTCNTCGHHFGTFNHGNIE